MGTKPNAHRRAEQAYRLLVQHGVKLLVIGDNKLPSNEQVESIGYIEHQRIYEYTIRAHAGLIPWKPHFFQRYCNPNKYYQYMHSGALPIIPNLLALPEETFSLRFKHVREIPALIDKAKQQDASSEIVEFAKANLVLEQHDKTLSKAYEVLLDVQ